MRRSAAVPFGLPVPRGTAPILWSPQAAILSVGLLLAPILMFALLTPWLVQVLARQEVLTHAQTFGFDVGELRDAQGGTYWGFTAVAPGGAASRAGLQVRDVIWNPHTDASASTLLRAVQAASRGEDACFDVHNLDDNRQGRDALRRICLERP
jgi:hypothetical protein